MFLLSMCTATLCVPRLAVALKFVALPDTQIYSQDRQVSDTRQPPITDPMGTYRYFVDQTQWVADNWITLGIDYVVHLGDIVQTDQASAQWVRAKAAMDLLDQAGVPYGTVIGNHDAHEQSSGLPYYDMYVQDYGPQHFVGRPWYGGASPTGASNYQIIGDGQIDVLFLNLSIAAPLEELDWAGGVLRQHRDKLVVLTTHAYMWDVFAAFGRYGEDLGPLSGLGGTGVFDQFHAGEGKTAQEIYEEFIQSHPNIIMAQGGHFDADLYRLDGRNGSNLPVLEIVSDYQSLLNGGDGYLRIYEIDATTDRITVETYSPTLDRTRTTLEHFVNSIALIYRFRDDVADALGTTPEIAFDFLAGLFKTDSVPGVDVVGQHPDYLADAGFYDQLFSDQFRGAIPPEVGAFSDWESLWVSYFAADPDNPTDYGPSVRSPGYSVDMDFDRYLTADRVVSTKQRACVVKATKRATSSGGVLRYHNGHIEQCIRRAGRGVLGPVTVDECITAGSARVARAEAKATSIEAKACTGPEAQPEFGFTGAENTNTVARAQSAAMTADLLGGPPLAIAPFGEAANECQTRASIQSNALLEKILRHALEHAKQALAGGTTNNADLTVDMLADIDTDPTGIVARSRERLHGHVHKRCILPGVDVNEHLAGECADAGMDADSLTDCIEDRARCRACETLNGVHGSAVSCDFFDDGNSLNQSCP